MGGLDDGQPDKNGWASEYAWEAVRGVSSGYATDQPYWSWDLAAVFEQRRNGGGREARGRRNAERAVKETQVEGFAEL